MSMNDRPLWYDVYRAFPPAVPPRFERSVPDIPIKQILYREDIIRARLTQFLVLSVGENVKFSFDCPSFYLSTGHLENKMRYRFESLQATSGKEVCYTTHRVAYSNLREVCYTTHRVAYSNLREVCYTTHRVAITVVPLFLVVYTCHSMIVNTLVALSNKYVNSPMITQEVSLLVSLYLPVEPTLGTAKTDVSGTPLTANVEILVCKGNSIGLVYCGRSLLELVGFVPLHIRVCHALPALTGEAGSELAFPSFKGT
ncbi:structural constituent of ribosome [Homalodisca vitripennis]|nr:structural constituent of ribosome [Homalodisca vitripennis]